MIPQRTQSQVWVRGEMALYKGSIRLINVGT